MGEAWWILIHCHIVVQCEIMFNPSPSDNLDTAWYAWYLILLPFTDPQHGVSLMAIHGHIRLTSPPHTSRFASNPWRSCGQRKPAIPDSRNSVLRVQTGMVYKHEVWESPLMMFNSIQQPCSKFSLMTTLSMTDSSPNAQSSTGHWACAELRCRATRQTAMVSCLAVRTGKWSNLLLIQRGFLFEKRLLMCLCIRIYNILLLQEKQA